MKRRQRCDDGEGFFCDLREQKSGRGKKTEKKNKKEKAEERSKTKGHVRRRRGREHKNWVVDEKETNKMHESSDAEQMIAE